jgi:2-keto-4-pentenoate hydratase/2-oxohepta-3-ene-1,7-dioic acid hydratase in catechol pathway
MERLKLASYVTPDGRSSYGAIGADGIVDYGGRAGAGATLRAFLAAGGGGRGEVPLPAAADFPLDAVTFAPVIPDPDKIICVGLNYAAHVKETGREVTEKPALFPRFAGCQVGHLQPMIRPRESAEFDYEGELAVIIGKGGRHIAVEDALFHVAGYACYNDGSIRDWQRHTSQFLPGKNFVGTGAFGPWMVTTDEIPDPSRLMLTTRLNGRVVQHSSTGEMINPVPKLIAYISTFIPLLPGDVIVTGTPEGVGMKRSPPLWMKPGDVVEVEIGSIGILRNSVVGA